MTNIFFFPKIVPFMRYVEKYGTARQSTDDHIIGSIRFACWTSKARDTHSEYVILIVSPRQRWFGETAAVLRVPTSPALGCLHNREAVRFTVKSFDTEHSRHPEAYCLY